MKTLMLMKLVYKFERYESQHHVSIEKLPSDKQNDLEINFKMLFLIVIFVS